MSSDAQDLKEDPVQHQQVTQSTILYLLQEATKLSAPAGEPSEAHVFLMHEDSSRDPTDLMDPTDPTGSITDPTGSITDPTGSFSITREADSSAWEVMRLINQQCEWLLRSGGEEAPSHPCCCPPALHTPAGEEEEMKEPGALVELLMSHAEARETPPLTSCPGDAPLWPPSAHAGVDVNNNLTEAQDSRAQRKQPRPVRSPQEGHGVTFSMRPQVDPRTERCHLLITSNYREKLKRLRRRRRSLQTSQRSSTSEEESDSCGASRGKMCASCLTRKTPLWRDAEDGTPLCNACGIRYKKYRVRCHHCWNIPKKENKSNSQCLKCGDALSLQQKCSGW